MTLRGWRCDLGVSFLFFAHTSWERTASDALAPPLPGLPGVWRPLLLGFASTSERTMEKLTAPMAGVRGGGPPFPLRPPWSFPGTQGGPAGSWRRRPGGAAWMQGCRIPACWFGGPAPRQPAFPWRLTRKALACQVSCVRTLPRALPGADGAAAGRAWLGPRASGASGLGLSRRQLLPGAQVTKRGLDLGSGGGGGLSTRGTHSINFPERAVPSIPELRPGPARAPPSGRVLTRSGPVPTGVGGLGPCAPAVRQAGWAFARGPSSPWMLSRGRSATSHGSHCANPQRKPSPAPLGAGSLQRRPSANAP